MKISIYDKSFNRVAIIGERFVSCLWSEGYNTVEPFTLELNDIDEYRKVLKLDYYVGRADRKTLMVIKSIEYKGGHIVVSGKQAVQVLDDIAFVGTIKKGKYIDVVIPEKYELTRKYPGVEFAETQNGIKYDGQISHKSFLELCSIMCQETDCGFKFTRSGNGGLVGFYKPDKKDAVFSNKYGNMVSVKITLSNSGEKNYAIVLGEGEGEERKRVEVDLTNGKERRDLIVDAPDIQPETDETDEEYFERLRARGVERLLGKNATEKCDFTPLDIEFGKSFDLGDIVTANLKEHGLKIEGRVVKFTQKAQKNKVETTINVGKMTFKR